MDLSRYLPQLIEGNSGETSRNSIMNIDFIAGEFSSFCQILHIHIPRLAYFFENNFPIFFNLKKIATISFNMKVCLGFYIFIFFISVNLAKYTYG